MKKRLGFIVPSSNTILEPVTSKLCEEISDLSVHYARIRVTGIGLSGSALGQFEQQKLVAASDLLADAQTDLIAWNGTSGSWLGADYDRGLCEAIAAATGKQALTTTLAYHELLARAGIRRVGFVTPYTRPVQEKIETVWRAAGFDCVDERHLELEKNFAFGEVSEAVVEDMVMEVGRSGCEAIVILCTNLLGAWIAPRAEAALGVPVLDSVSVTFRASLDRLGLSPAPLARWGRVFGAEPVRGSAEAARSGLQVATSSAVAAPLPAHLVGHRTRKRIQPFRLQRPETVPDAVAAWRESGRTGAILAGGVDLINEMKEGAVFRDVIDLRRVAPLQGISILDDHARLGATVTHDALASAALPGALASFARGWGRIANPRVRHKGTLGGNLMAGNPTYDLAPCLIALGAKLAGWDRDGAAIVTDVASRPPRANFFLTEIRLPRSVLAFAHDRAERPAISVAVAAHGQPDAVTRISFGLVLYGRLIAVEVPLSIGLQASALQSAAADILDAAGARLPDLVAEAPVSSRQCLHLAAVMMRRAFARI